VKELKVNKHHSCPWGTDCLWNPVKELKVVRGVGRPGDSGSPVESGEGIERGSMHGVRSRVSASWNPVKELKDLHVPEDVHAVGAVESGEGIESRSTWFILSSPKGVESGEGIERFSHQGPQAIQNHFLWNPVKELKVTLC